MKIANFYCKKLVFVNSKYNTADLVVSVDVTYVGGNSTVTLLGGVDNKTANVSFILYSSKTSGTD